MIYGGGSIRKNDISEQVMKLLKANSKAVVEDSGVMPNPTVEKLREGVLIARENRVDLLLAVGGGSCCDYAKAVSVSVHCDEDPWEEYYIRFEEPDCEIVPASCVLTVAALQSARVLARRFADLLYAHITRGFPRCSLGVLDLFR